MRQSLPVLRQTQNPPISRIITGFDSLQSLALPGIRY
jgi:hypothetical protein